MSARQAARRRLERIGLSPRYANRIRWLSKARVLRAYDAPIRANVGHLLAGAEIDNFTYELANERELADFLTNAFAISGADAGGLLREAGEDEVLRRRLRDATRRRWWTKTSPPFGRRLGWYAAARILKPRLIVETGIHDGLGSLVLLRALERNAEDGRPGELLAFDVYPRAGWIVGGHPRWRRVIEPTQTALVRELQAGPPVGLFIHDSLHSYSHERFELDTAADHLAPTGALISDNAHATSALRDVCEARGLRYSYFQERPKNHFYPGSGIGLGLRG